MTNINHRFTSLEKNKGQEDTGGVLRLPALNDQLLLLTHSSLIYLAPAPGKWQVQPHFTPTNPKTKEFKPHRLDTPSWQVTKNNTNLNQYTSKRTMKHLHLTIKGKVQGVFYRHNTVKQAHKLQIKGFVRNLPNGDVEVIAEGPEDKLKQLIEWCKKGPDNAIVDGVIEQWKEPHNDYVNFAARH